MQLTDFDNDISRQAEHFAKWQVRITDAGSGIAVANDYEQFFIAQLRAGQTLPSDWSCRIRLHP